MRLRTRKEFFSQRFEFFGRQLIQDCRIVATGFEPFGEVLNIGKLVSAFDHRMADKYLLDQSRARARPAYDENRITCVATDAASAFQEMPA